MRDHSLFCKGHESITPKRSATTSLSALCTPASCRRTAQSLWNCHCHCPGPRDTAELIWRIVLGKQSLQSCCAAVAELAENLCVTVLKCEIWAVLVLEHELWSVIVLTHVEVLHIFNYMYRYYVYSFRSSEKTISACLPER